MSKILVFGHKNPDNDAIMSAVMYSQLAAALDPANEYVACRLGELPGESAALLEKHGVAAPQFLEKIEPADEKVKVVLTDHNELGQTVEGIENAEVVEKVEVAADVVTIGSRVRVLDVDEDVEEEYTIVGSQEANPMEGCISDDSPFGFALKGHKVGETVTVAAPVGELQFKIIAVENED